MKNQLDIIMKDHGIDVLLITGPAQHNPAMVYFTGVAHVSMADLVKKIGQKPILFHPPMEREEAAKSGLALKSYNDYPFIDFLKQAKDDRNLAAALRYQKMLKDCGVEKGRVALYGQTDLGSGYVIFDQLQRLMPEVKFTGYVSDELLMQAMMTKDEDEIKQMKDMARITVETVARTADYLQGHKDKNGVLIQKDGSPLTIGKVKGLINLWLAELGAENPEGTVFAIGRDAGIPHSIGTDSDTLRTGQTIVYDIFPCQAGGGYYYDFTRTWCLGHAPDKAQKLYDEVYSVYKKIMASLKINTPFLDYQKQTCTLFEEMGHPTVATDMKTEIGYVHSIGHGVGLRVHEMPFSGYTSTAADAVVPGSVFSIEPGLYYPEKGMGIRLEDTVWARPDGRFEILAEYPMDLILKVK